MFEELHTRQHIEHCALAHPFRKGKELSGGALAQVIALTVLLLKDLGHALGTNCVELLVQKFVVVLCNEVVRFEFGLLDRAAIAVDELDRHVVAMFGKETDSSFTSFDPLVDVPDGGALLNEVGTALLSKVVLGAFLLLLDHLLEFVVREVVLGRVYVLLFDFFVAIFFVLFHVNNFLRLLHDAVAVHVVQLLLLHVLEAWDRLKFGLSAGFGGGLFANDFLGVLHHGKGVLGQVVGVVGV